MEKQIFEQIKKRTLPFLEAGFAFEYFHEKGGDSSCVYICRYKKGKDYFDWREASGVDEIHFVVYANGEYQFPNVKPTYKKGVLSSIKRFIKKPSMDEKRDAFAKTLLDTLQENPKNFYGIKL